MGTSSIQVWPVKANHERRFYLISLSLAVCKYPGQPVKDDGNLGVGFPRRTVWNRASLPALYSLQDPAPTWNKITCARNQLLLCLSH